MPDKVLNFVKDHFLMDGLIRSQPLLLKRNVRYTQIAVDRVQLGEKAYHVLFIGTGTELRSHTRTYSDPDILTNCVFFILCAIICIWTKFAVPVRQLGHSDHTLDFLARE